MGVRPMSPSANFTTYNLPQADDVHSFALPRPKGGRALDAFKNLLFCSRPCFQQSVDLDQEDSLGLHQYDDSVTSPSKSSDAEELRLRLEMQSLPPHYVDYLNRYDRASGRVLLPFLRHVVISLSCEAVLRHLEVRWQLFNEALSKYGDLEAMLAICADKMRWRCYTCEGAKDAQLGEKLRSLIARKLSMEVTIERITRLSPTGDLGTSFDSEGRCGKLQPSDGAEIEAALELFHKSRVAIGNDWLRSSRLCVLEEDSYTLCGQRGEVVEEGKQVVIWEQYNATWYVRGCVSFPSSTTS